MIAFLGLRASGILVALALLMVARATAAADGAIEMQRMVPLVSARFDGDAEPGPRGAGLVFAATPERMYVVTAAHIVRKRGRSASAIDLRFGPDRPAVRARLERFDDKGLDVAVLVVEEPRKAGLDVDGLPFDRLAAGSPRRGDPVFMLGEGSERRSVKVTPDRISAIRDGTIAFETKLGAPGFSGAPLLNGRWQLIGLIVRDNVPEGEARALPAVIDQLKRWRLPNELREPYAQVAAGSHVSCRIGRGGAARCWGALEFDGFQPSHDRLTIDGVRWQSLSVGVRNLCGVDVAGTAWCLGQNSNGQLGNGSTVASMTSAVRVAGGLTFKAVSVGGHACGLTTEGAAWCWGQGDYGQLGSDADGNSAVPLQVGGALAFRSISAGLLHTCAVTPDGRAWCWGSNEMAAFSAGAPMVVHKPLPVSGSARFVAIGASCTHTCALAADDAVYCWGQNDLGQLGDGTERDSTTPVRVIGNQRFKRLSTSVTSSYNCALGADGTAWCWGVNNDGQLGNGSKTQSNRPVAVSGGLRFISITAGRFHTCGVTRDDTIWCWGGLNGLGTGHHDGSTVPVRVNE